MDHDTINNGPRRATRYLLDLAHTVKNFFERRFIIFPLPVLCDPDKPRCMKTVRKGIYLPADVAEEMAQECERLDCTLNWLMRRIWKIASPRIRQFPGVEELEGQNLPQLDA